MEIKSFETEHFFAQYEFNTPYQLCNSDCETVSTAELLDMADMSLDQLGEMRLGYTESMGNPQLRELIAAGYPQNVAVDDVFVLGTPVEGIYLTARAVLNPGDEVVVLAPAYDALITMFEHVAGEDKVKKWEFVPRDGRWALDLDDLRALITPKTKMVVVNFPHNPTGYVPSPEQQAELIEIIEAHQLWLFCDEMYYGLIHSGTPEIPSACELSDRAIVLSGLSKTYGLPGLRTGWMVVRDQELRENIFNWKFYTSICPPAPSEFLAIAALRAREQLRLKNIALIEKNLALAEQFFAKHADLFTWRRPIAGSTGLVGMNVPSAAAYSAKLAEEAGILIQSAEMLGSDDHHIRMGFGRAAFGEALAKFDDYLQAQHK